MRTGRARGMPRGRRFPLQVLPEPPAGRAAGDGPLPVSAKIALASAGATGGTGGSPSPEGGAALGTKWTSTRGASFIRSSW